MIQRLCDRCRADALPLPDQRSTIIVPSGKPSTNPVTADAEITIGVSVAQDLCGPCFASAVLQFAIAKLGAGGLSEASAAVLAGDVHASARLQPVPVVGQAEAVTP